MSALFWVDDGDRYPFTRQLLCWWFNKSGGKVVDRPEDADFLALSICSPDAYSVLTRAKQVANDLKKPLVVGGIEGYVGATYLAWADYICVGEGFGLLQDLATSIDVRGTLEGRHNVLYAARVEEQITPDYWVPWEFPVFGQTKHTFRALGGRGCRHKCRFCMTSWVQPYQPLTPERIASTIAAVRKSGRKNPRINFISNDYGFSNHCAGSTTVKLFLEEEHKRWPQEIRLGIEGLTEARRRFFSKPIPDELISGAIQKAERVNVNLALFWIIGFPDDPSAREWAEKFILQFEPSASKRPVVAHKWTFFEPSPHTPLGGWDCGQLVDWDARLASRILAGHLHRTRMLLILPLSSALYRSIFRRLEPEQAALWARWKKNLRKEPPAEVCSLAAKLFGSAVVDGTGKYPWHRIKTSVRSA
jgi:radical SAM superfamily enzyme YgiQ (UPF0313 family)